MVFKGGYIPIPEQITADLTEVKATADQALATGQNAQQMVRNRDPRLTALESDTVTLKQVAATVQELSAESTADRLGLHSDVSGLQSRMAAQEARAMTPGPKGDPGPPGASIKGDKGDKGDPGTPADMTRVTALEAQTAALQAALTAVTARVAALEAKTVTVANGAAALPASLLAGASANVVVTLTRPMGATTFSVGYALEGGQSLLGNVSITGFAITSQSVVTLTVRNNGLAGLLNLSAATAHVVAVRNA